MPETNHPILIIEDDQKVSRAIQGALQQHGYQARAANLFSSGLSLAEEHAPALLVLDLALPDGSGWDLLARIRQTHPASPMPVIVISSGAVTRAQLTQHRVDRFIAKPFPVSQLLETVHTLLDAPLGSAPPRG